MIGSVYLLKDIIINRIIYKYKLTWYNIDE